MSFSLPKNPEDMRKWDTSDLKKYRYEYCVGIAERETYYHTQQPTHENLCCEVAIDELEKRKREKPCGLTT